ncbi:DUF3644 domain-containing protein [Streptomyces sp. NPDC089424]|uniref:DUF3644 domain-containing protein n=1 Tax=Streptomyces sp. NPDC089424 TaxID=3365917 RepID=UPI00380C8051
MAHPRWHHILMESQRHALKALDEWNCSSGDYSDFLTHMHKAWHYLLHAEFHRANIDYHYRDARTGRHQMIDGEPKAWDLEKCLKERFLGSGDRVRLNAELFVALRNKVEHRYEHNLRIVTGGRAQAYVINYEQEMAGHFGAGYSLADRLRFPLSVQALTADGYEEMRKAARQLPRKTRDLVARYEAGIDPSVLDDPRYDYRVRLVPITGSKTDADLAVNFVKLDDLTEDERRTMVEAGRSGTVITRDRHVEVADLNRMRPTQVAARVEEQLPFRFSASREHAEMWKRLRIRPVKGSDNPYATVPRYCSYNEAFDQYVYTQAWINKILKEIGTAELYRAFFGREPRMKTRVVASREAA